jgi:hypothetical protein
MDHDKLVNILMVAFAFGLAVLVATVAVDLVDFRTPFDLED